MQPLVSIVPALQVGVMAPSHPSVAVINASALVQVGGVGLQPKAIGPVGHPVITGGVISTFQL